MTLTPEEARTQANELLAAMYATVTDWDEAIYDQVVLHLADTGRPIGMNQIRRIVPDGAAKGAGLYFHSLISHDIWNPDEAALLVKVGEEVSINKKARGKKVNVYRLTRAGRKHIQARRAARIEQRRAAA